MNNKIKIFLPVSIALVVIIIVVGIFLFNKNNYYIIEFDSLGGTLVETQKVEAGKKIKEPEVPIKEGYVFIGWFNGNKIFDFSLPVEEDVKLIAKWEKVEEDIISYIIKFDSQGGTTIENQIVKENGMVNKPIDPEKEGYIFKGWKKENEFYNFDDLVTNDLVLIANWEKKEEVKKQTSTSNKNNQSNTSNKTQSTQTTQSTNIPQKVKLPTPTITENGKGGDENGNWGKGLKLNYVDNITGVEVYSSTGQNATYTLYKTVLSKDLRDGDTIDTIVSKGQHLYFKVRTYVKSSTGTYYSGYSNVIDVDNS